MGNMWRLSDRVSVEVRDPHGENEQALLVIEVDGTMAVRHFLDPVAREAIERALAEALEGALSRMGEKALSAERAVAHAALASHHARWLLADIERVADELRTLRGASVEGDEK